jgi:hypothetical protein
MLLEDNIFSPAVVILTRCKRYPKSGIAPKQPTITYIAQGQVFEGSTKPYKVNSVNYKHTP